MKNAVRRRLRRAGEHEHGPGLDSENPRRAEHHLTLTAATFDPLRPEKKASYERTRSTQPAGFSYLGSEQDAIDEDVANVGRGGEPLAASRHPNKPPQGASVAD